MAPSTSMINASITLRRAHLEMLIDSYARTPDKGKHMLVAIRKLLKIAAGEEWIDSDPSALVEWRPAYGGWRPGRPTPWNGSRSAGPVGSAARTCYGLALWLGNRRGDVASLRWDQRRTRRIMIDGKPRNVDGFEIVQGKNASRTGGKALFLPVTPMLAEILAAAPRTAETVLATACGQPFSEKSLTGAMAHWTKLAGLPKVPKGNTLHGVRKSLGVYIAESHSSTRPLMEVLGHDDIEHAELYSREASQMRLAVQGMDKVTRLVRKR
jgi:integrase